MIYWRRHPELLERTVRLRAEGKYFKEIAPILGVKVESVYRHYASKKAKNLCRKLGLPYFAGSLHKKNYSDQDVESVVRMRSEQKMAWTEIANLTGFGVTGMRIRTLFYSAKGRETRKRLGVYRTKNLRIQMAGKRIGKLKVIRMAGHSEDQRVLWRCKCSCGAVIRVSGVSLRLGTTKSCGGSVHRVKHGGTSNKLIRPTYLSYVGMLQRCLNPNNVGYEHYGGRGITVCARWRGKDGFKNFLADRKRRPKNKTNDRINPNGHYSCGHCEECIAEGWPSNCRWATDKVQANNKQRKHPPLNEAEKAALLESSKLSFDEDPY